MTFGADGFHGLSRQFGGQSELTLFFIPESVAHRDRKIEDFSIMVSSIERKIGCSAKVPGTVRTAFDTVTSFQAE